jgi:hypothetical protein
VCGAVCALPPYPHCVAPNEALPYVKCFHVNQLCCSQHKLLCKTIGGGLPFKIMYLFTGSSDKMPFQVIKNDHVVVVCAHCHLGPQ